MRNKTSKEYWEQIYETTDPDIADKKDIIRQWIEQQFRPLSKEEKKSCLEIGCYPGRYLSVFGELGYELFGVDYCGKVDNLATTLENSGYRVGRIWKENFFRFNTQKKFDIVASFGFIEHFENYQEVIKKHISHLNDQGYLVIVVPNFIGWFQHWYHVTFDRVNYDRHHIPAMDIEKWVDIIEKENLKIIYQGYFGKFHYWTDYENRNRWEELFLKTLGKLITPILKRVLPKDKKMYSPCGGVIAQKQ